MNKFLKKCKKLFDVICWILIGVLVLTVVLFSTAKIFGKTPSFFGYSIYRVSSPSMEPELMVGDVILAKVVDDPSTLKVGDIVTYRGSGELSDMLITHKIIVAPHLEDGVLMLQTKGVANDTADSPISAESVVSIAIEKIGFISAFYNYFFSPWGLLTVIGLFVLIFIDEIVRLVYTLSGHSVGKQKSIDEIIEGVKASEQVNYKAGIDKIDKK